MLALQTVAGHNTATYDARINGLVLRARAFLESINLIELDNITADIIHRTDVMTGHDSAANESALSALYSGLDAIRDTIKLFSE